VKYHSTEHPISWFKQRYEEGSLEIRPPYQRRPVWVQRQKSKLIESILMELPVPEIYIDESTTPDGRTTYAVVDGQQRIRTILQFLGVDKDKQEQEFNSFALGKLGATSEWKDKTFENLIKDQKQQFYGALIAVRALKNPSESEVRDMFRRLNAYLTKLNDQELRNATYSGPFVSLVSELANDSYWTENKIVSTANIRRMKDIQFVSELLIGVIYGPQGGSARDIDEHYKFFEEYEDEFEGQASAKELYNKTLLTIQNILPDIREHRWHNQADFYSLFVVIAQLLKEKELRQNRKTVRRELVRFAEQVNRRLADDRVKVPSRVIRYVRAVEKGVTDRARRAARHRALLSFLDKYFTSGGKKSKKRAARAAA
jgi:hypothetical protein